MSNTALAQPKLFGLIALSQGMITKEQLDECLEAQWGSTGAARLGAIMLERGYLTDSQIMEILKIQSEAAAKTNTPKTKSERKKRLGEILIERGYIDWQTLTAGLRQQKLLRKNGLPPRLGEILVALGRITRDQLTEALNLQRGASSVA